MPLSWFALIVATILLSGIAGLLIGWLASRNRQARLERDIDRRFGEMTHAMQAVEGRVRQFEETGNSAGRVGDAVRSSKARSRWSAPPWPTNGTDPTLHRSDGSEPPLIAVPNLAAAANDREVVVNGLTQRYAAIWSLAESGSSAEVIARATGQPIGQIELILGLRRQIDGTRTNIPHAPHT